MKWIMVFIIALMFVTVRAHAQSGNLLNNVCASSSGMVDCTTGTPLTAPAGWTLFGTEGFESNTCSSLGSTEACLSGSPSTALAHSGTHSEHGSNSTALSIRFPAGHIESYVSFWEWLGPAGAFNDEVFQWHVKVTNSSGLFQEVNLDWCCSTTAPTANQYNGTSAPLALIPQSSSSSGETHNYNGPSMAGAWGAGWVQWEIHYRANTISSGAPNADGVFQVWKNGVQVVNRSGLVLNNSFDMSQSTMQTQVGGHYTKLVWLTNCSSGSTCNALMTAGGPFSCAGHIGASGAYGVNPISPYTIFNQPCAPQAPQYDRYIDDVIFLYRSSSSPPPPPPPPNTAPQVSASPASLTFSSQTIGTTSAGQAVTFVNTGGAAANISNVSATGNFTEASSCGSSIANGSSCTVTVKFIPQSAGSLNGTLAMSFTNNPTVSVPLQGTGASAVPTTSISALTQNNTSGSSLFPGWTDGNNAAGNISKLNLHNLFQPSTVIGAHLMPWFCGAPTVSLSSTCGGHLEVGYNSNDSTQVQLQLNDMASRGIDVVILDWYGAPTRTNGNGVTVTNTSTSDSVALKLKAATGPKVIIMYDFGALKAICQNYITNGYSSQQTCVTDIMIEDMRYLDSTYWGSSRYYKVDGFPVQMVFEYDQNFTNVTDWTSVWDSVKNFGYINGPPQLIFGNHGGFTHVDTSGAYSWGPAQTGLTYSTSFYSTSLSYPSLETWGGLWPGFNDTLASWSLNRINPRNCGMTWMSIAHSWVSSYSTANPVPFLQLVTWNDYEEGSEIETGIDNCIAWATPTVSGSTLTWAVGINANSATIDHFEVYSSQDGGVHMTLVAGNISPTTSSVDLSHYTIASGTYSMYVYAVGQPSVKNSLSPAVGYNTAGTVVPPPTLANPKVALTLSPSSGQPGLVTTASVTVSDSISTITGVAIDWGDGSAPQTLFGSVPPTPTPPPVPPPPTGTFYTLSAFVRNNGGTINNSISSNVGGINCPGTCSTRLLAGTSVTVTAHPNRFATFVLWGGGTCSGSSLTCTFTMNANKSVLGEFAPTN